MTLVSSIGFVQPRVRFSLWTGCSLGVYVTYLATFVYRLLFSEIPFTRLVNDFKYPMCYTLVGDLSYGKPSRLISKSSVSHTWLHVSGSNLNSSKRSVFLKYFSKSVAVVLSVASS